MSTDQYENEAPTGEVADNDYLDRPGEKGGPVSVQKDSAVVEDPIDASTADSDEQLREFATSPIRPSQPSCFPLGSVGGDFVPAQALLTYLQKGMMPMP